MAANVRARAAPAGGSPAIAPRLAVSKSVFKAGAPRVLRSGPRAALHVVSWTKSGRGGARQRDREHGYGAGERRGARAATARANSGPLCGMLWQAVRKLWLCTRSHKCGSRRSSA